MERVTFPVANFAEWADSQRAERAQHDNRMDIIDRDVVCYYADQNDPNVWHASKLQVGDHVTAYGMPVEVIGPGEGRSNFAGGFVNEGDSMPSLSVFPLDSITDRAPLDANEPQPWFPLIPTGAP